MVLTGLLLLGSGPKCAPEPRHLTMPALEGAASVLLAIGQGTAGDPIQAFRAATFPPTLSVSSAGDARLSLALHPRSLPDLGLEEGPYRAPEQGPTRPLPPGARFYSTPDSEPAGVGSFEATSAPPPPFDSVKLPLRCLDSVPDAFLFGLKIPRSTTATVHVDGIAALDAERVLVVKSDGSVSVASRSHQIERIGALAAPGVYRALRTSSGEILIAAGDGTLYRFDAETSPLRLPAGVPGGAPRSITSWVSSLAGETPEVLAVSDRSRVWILDGERFSEVDLDRPLAEIGHVAWIAPGLYALAGLSTCFLLQRDQVIELAVPGAPPEFKAFACGGNAAHGVLLGGEVVDRPGARRAVFFLASLDGETVVPLDLSWVEGYFWTPKRVLPFGRGLLIAGDDGGIGYYDDGFCPSEGSSHYTLELATQIDDRHAVLAGEKQRTVSGFSHELIWVETLDSRP